MSHVIDYRPDIDGLRAFAVLSVIIYHANHSFLSGGFLGVDIFFVISGFLITSIIIKEYGLKTFSLASFYERRARRILPPLVAMVFVISIASYFILLPEDMKDYSNSLVAIALFVSNFHFYGETGYFETIAEFQPMLHTWSLAVEEQYYLLFPLGFIIFYKRHWVKWFKILLWGVFFTSFGIALVLYTQHPNAVFFLLPTRAWELLAGVLCAIYFNDIQKFCSKYNGIASFVGFCLVIGSVIFITRDMPTPGWTTLAPVLGAVLIICCSSADNITGRFLSWRPFVWIGLLSYSLYLWHQPLFVMYRYNTMEHIDIMATIILVTVTFIAAMLSYYFLEKPIRNRTFFRTRARAFIASGVGVFVIIMLGILLHLNDGLYDRFKNTRFEQLMETASSSPYRDACHAEGRNYLPPNQACIYNSEFKEHNTWAGLGDSHMVELTYALAQKLEGRNQSILHLTYRTARPTVTVVEDNMYDDEWMKDALDRIIRDKNLQNIVVSFRLTGLLYGGHEGQYPALPNTRSQQQKDMIWKGLIDIFDLLLQNDKTVYFVLQAPEIKMPVKILMAGINEDGVSVGSSKQWWDARQAYVRQHISEIPTGVKIIDPTGYFCDHKNCYAIKDGRSLYYDDDHMSVYGASIIADKIIAGK